MLLILPSGYLSAPKGQVHLLKFIDCALRFVIALYHFQGSALSSELCYNTIVRGCCQHLFYVFLQESWALPVFGHFAPWLGGAQPLPGCGQSVVQQAFWRSSAT